MGLFSVLGYHSETDGISAHKKGRHLLMNERMVSESTECSKENQTAVR